MTLSRSKNREEGIRFARNASIPFFPAFGRNHVAQRATVRGEVEILEGELALSASDSSLGVTR